MLTSRVGFACERCLQALSGLRPVPSTIIYGSTLNAMAVESTLRKQLADATATFRAAPHNIEVEQALLGAILVNNEAFYRVSDFLEPQHFFEPIHQKLYQVTRDLLRAGKVASPV